MRKLNRLLLWVVGGLSLLACAILLGVNLYVQSQGVHHRIQQELSQRLNTPLELRQISVTPWSGLKLSGITIPQTRAGITGNFLDAETFQLRVKFWSLFGDRLVIRQVSLIKPRVRWAQNSPGKWRLPELPPEKIVPAPSSAEPVSPVASANTTPKVSASLPSTPNELPNGKAGAANEAAAFTPEVRRVNLHDGDFTFLDSAGHDIARFSGLDFNSSFRTATDIQGRATIARISLRDRFFIEQLESPLDYDPAALVFSNISARAAGGTLNGNFRMQLQARDSPFRAIVKFRDLQAAQLVANAGGPANIIQGKLEGSLEATGETAHSDALVGRGEIFLRGGTLQQYSLLVALGQILQIDELTQLHLEQAEAHFRINPGVVTIDQLLLRSPNIRLSATGTIDFNGRMRLNSQLALDEKIRRQLFSPIQENFQPLSDPPGYAAIDFHVSGTVDRPKTDLMDKVVGRDLRDLGGVISSLFGRHAKKKKAAPEISPSPSPNESQAGPSPNESATESPPNESPTAAPTP